MKLSIIIAALLATWQLLHPLKGENPSIFQKGEVLTFCGDSITEQSRYTVFIAAYLQACQPQLGVTSIQNGKGGATAESFLVRMDSSETPFKPNVITLCFGMNDGTVPLYRDHMVQIIAKMKQAGVRYILLGSPGAVGEDGTTPQNQRLAAITQSAKEIAEKEGLGYVNLHDIMVETRSKAMAKYGDKYLVMGRDSVHPDNNGHLIMAYGFLKGMGFKGDIGTITIDMKEGKATALEGDKVISYANGTITLESTRYPFCFSGDPASPESTTGMIEFIPFNQDLNRYMLVVKNASAPKMKVTWGKTSKTFTAEQLSSGINLAAEFLDNPFSEPFANFLEVLRHQQQLDLRLEGPGSLIEYAVSNQKKYPEQGGKIYDQTVKATVEFEKVVRTNTQTKLAPVTHSILIEPAGA